MFDLMYIFFNSEAVYGPENLVQAGKCCFAVEHTLACGVLFL